MAQVGEIENVNASAMERVNLIKENETYKECLGKIAECEIDRIYCKHNMEHFMDVARIAYIMVLEKGLNIKKDIIYATALLHDIGRFEQYLRGIPHEEASAELAPEILEAGGFSNDEIQSIITAIASHRKDKGEAATLESIFYQSDKLSRACYNCRATETCNWSDEKKNMKIKY